MIGRVGEMLRLERDAITHPIDLAAFSDGRAVDEIARIKLEPGLVAEDVHAPSGDGILQTSNQSGCPAGRPANNIIVIVAATDDDLRMRVADPFLDQMRRAEVER